MNWASTPKFIQKTFSSYVFNIKNNINEIYITFDDGPSKELTFWILDILNKQQIKATFFCIGRNAVKYPNAIQRIVVDGHKLGNHSYSHKNGWFSSKKKYLSDIEKCKSILPPSNLFRPPYGKILPCHSKSIEKEYKIIMWDILSYDFKKNISKNKIISNVINNVCSGSIIVFHDNNSSKENLKKTLEEIIVMLKERGFSFGIIS